MNRGMQGKLDSPKHQSLQGYKQRRKECKITTNTKIQYHYNITTDDGLRTVLACIDLGHML